jgi:hypothetical protein
MKKKQSVGEAWLAESPIKLQARVLEGRRVSAAIN